MKMNANRNGFTLVEMLVVLGIIAVLSGALLAGFGRVTKSAQRARAQETVSNVATALGILLQKEGAWPLYNGKNVLATYGGQDGEGKGCVKDVTRLFAQKKLLGITYKYDEKGEIDIDKGTDRCGIVDPWAIAVLKRSADNNESTPVPSGGTVKSHIIYYAIDTDLDGITEAKVCGEDIKVRASAIAWCAGADGELGSSYRRRSKQNADNIYSWRKNQEEKQ